MDNLFDLIKQQVRQHKQKRIVFPEIMDERILHATNELAKENLLIPVYIGSKQSLQRYERMYQLELVNYELIDPIDNKNKREMAHSLIDRRYKKIDEVKAYQLIAHPLYFAAMLVYLNKVDGLIAGATYTTAEAVRPVLEIIQTKEGITKTSGAMLMVREKDMYIFADCAININPSSEELAEISLLSAKTAELFQMEPKVALLSFSTRASSHAMETEKVLRATNLVKELAPSLQVDGELQFDAAFSEELAKKKAPHSELGGKANVFVFPNLDAGNISCKITEQLGGFSAIGPILQGMRKPVNLLSRGCSKEDIYKLALITAMQTNETQKCQT